VPSKHVTYVNTLLSSGAQSHSLWTRVKLRHLPCDDVAMIPPTAGRAQLHDVIPAVWTGFLLPRGWPDSVTNDYITYQLWAFPCHIFVRPVCAPLPSPLV